MIIGIPPKASKQYRKKVAHFAHEMVAMIENIKLAERQNSGFKRMDNSSSMGSSH